MTSLNSNPKFDFLHPVDLINDVPVGVYVVDPDFRLQYANKIALHAFGDIPKLIGRDFAEIMNIVWPKPKSEEIIAHFRHTLKTGESYVVTELVEQRNDRGVPEYYEWEIRQLVLQDGRHAVVCYFRDISEPVQVREAIARSNRELQQFASIVESSDDAIVSKNLNGIIASWNAGAERIFGYKAEEVIGKPVNILIPFDRQNEEPEILKRIIKGERIDHYETIRQRKDGTLVDISLTISPIKDAHGTIVGASKIGRDITLRKRAEENLKKLTAVLEERVIERTQLLEHQADRLRELAVELTQVEQKERRRLAEVLHDHLQQYLVAAKMRLEMFLRKTVGEDNKGLEEARSYVEKSIESSRQLTAELRPPVLYEGGLIAGVRYLAQKMQKQHHIQVHLSFSGEIEPGSDLIKVMIYQCIQELLFNAVKYAKITECFVRLGRLDNGFIEIVVEDKGVGFDVPNMGGIGKGGFGLFSIRERIKALQGEFNVISSPGKGAIFTISIPDELGPLTATAGPLDVSMQKAFVRDRSKKEGIMILVADDHPIIRHSIASLLRGQSFVKEVIEASNGEDAVRKAETLDPDVILMDINMPIINGIEATQILSKRKSRAKVIGLSVQPASEIAQAMKDVGAIAYFNKSDDTKSLIETIQKFSIS